MKVPQSIGGVNIPGTRSVALKHLSTKMCVTANSGPISTSVVDRFTTQQSLTEQILHNRVPCRSAYMCGRKVQEGRIPKFQRQHNRFETKLGQNGYFLSQCGQYRENTLMFFCKTDKLQRYPLRRSA